MKQKLHTILREALVSLRKNWWTGLLGMAIGIGVGLLCIFTNRGQYLLSFSYDTFFTVRDVVKTDEVVLLFMDEDSHTYLKQPHNRAWDRRIHARLLQRLKEEGAKGVVFDIVFSDPSDPEQDEAFAQAIADFGKVVLAADLSVQDQADSGVLTTRLDPPHEMFELAANGQLGLDVFYADPDVCVRRYVPGKTNSTPSEAWAAIEIVSGAIVTNAPERQYLPFWMNYYGHGGIPSYSYYRAITNELGNPLPAGIFKDKFVFVGAKTKTKFSGERKDEYRVPYSMFTEDPMKRFIPGVEIHATAFLNLLRGEWLSTFDPRAEFYAILFVGAFFGFGLILCRPLMTFILATLAIVTVIVSSYLLFVHQYCWFPWAVLCLQIFMTMTFAIVINSIRLYVQGKVLMATLSAHLSPKRAKQLLSQQGDMLKPGADKQMLTILFSDIESFTNLSEGVDSDELARLMNNYFETAVTQCIFKTDGTVIKYIGDAIFALWNAPEPQVNHHVRACEAALDLSKQAIVHEKNGQQQRFRTRVGLHTGPANVGNFGSKSRVDYTAIGENINLASRMEGLNKYLHTSVLITGATKEGLKDEFALRFCGKFQLKGFERAVEVYEIVSRTADAAASAAWRTAYARALELFTRRDFTAAEAAFRQVLELNPQDGPSQFYLREIPEFIAQPPAANWAGEVELKDK